ncbi:MAG: hypothetical protein LDL31_00445 [Prosthecobacter sp.]|jgi:hypothetical protein|nr:hypothetical protein [Prosthecobacter sp.]
MNYPLSFRFKLLALSPQIYVKDADGREVLYVKQKLFRLREKVEVHTDSSRQQQLCTIEADRIIDWSARYTFRDAAGRELGAVGRRGMRSLWSAHYDVFAPGSREPLFHIREENPMAKVLDGFFGELPIIGILTAFLFHPRYIAHRLDGTPVMRLTKQAAIFEGRFKLEKLADAAEGEEMAIILSFLMMNLLERRRG